MPPAPFGRYGWPSPPYEGDLRDRVNGSYATAATMAASSLAT
jgi:hypothetical protein